MSAGVTRVRVFQTDRQTDKQTDRQICCLFSQAKIVALGEWYSCRGLAVAANSGVSTLGLKMTFCWAETYIKVPVNNLRRQMSVLTSVQRQFNVELTLDWRKTDICQRRLFTGVSVKTILSSVIALIVWNCLAGLYQRSWWVNPHCTILVIVCFHLTFCQTIALNHTHLSRVITSGITMETIRLQLIYFDMVVVKR